MTDSSAQLLAVRSLSLVVLLAGALLLPGESDARPRRKPPTNDPQEQQQQDPMEVEHGTAATQPPPGPPPPAPPPPQPPQNNNSSANTASPPAKPVYEKPGRFMASLKIGPGICLYNCNHQGAAVIEFGYSVLPNKNAYLLLPLQFQFGPNGSSVIVPLGFQYDLEIPRVPGLYFYPRFSMGYALIINDVALGALTVHAGVIIPELGLKYVWKGRWNFGGEFFSLPIFFGQTSMGGFATMYYRILLSAGVNF
jgi:hypothetical protein